MTPLTVDEVVRLLQRRATRYFRKYAMGVEEQHRTILEKGEHP